MFCKKQIKLWPISGVEPFICRPKLMLMSQDLCLSSFALGWALEGSTLDLGLEALNGFLLLVACLPFGWARCRISLMLSAPGSLCQYNKLRYFLQ